jgi:hypothetical protein
MADSCPFYYEDSHRRFPRKECRLIRRQQSTQPWTDKLCRSCPVPEVLEQNPCANLALEAEVRSRFGLLRRIDLYSVCTLRMREISNPKECSQGCPGFEEA